MYGVKVRVSLWDFKESDIWPFGKSQLLSHSTWGKKQVWQPHNPILEPELFRKQIYCIEESACDVVGTFCPCSDAAPP